MQTGTVLQASAEERAITDAVRGMVKNYGPEYYQQEVDSGGHCAVLWKKLGDNGYLGVHLPEEYGGGGLGLTELNIVVHGAAVEGVPMQSMLFSTGVTGTVLARSANEEQKRRWLPAIATGETRLSFAITEPDAGSNAHRITTTARCEGAEGVHHRDGVRRLGDGRGADFCRRGDRAGPAVGADGRYDVARAVVCSDPHGDEPARQESPGVLRQCRGAGRESDRRRGQGTGGGLHGAEYRTGADQLAVYGHRPLRP